MALGLGDLPLRIDYWVVLMKKYWGPKWIPWGKIWAGLLRSISQCWGAGYPPWSLFSYWRNHRLRETLSVWHSGSLGEGWCKVKLLLYPSNVVPLSLCGPGVLFQPHLQVLEFSQWRSYLWIVASCFSYEDWSLEWPMSPSWWQYLNSSVF